MALQSLHALSHDHLAPLETPSEALGAHESPTSHRFERGQTLVEYALIIALVAIVVIAALYLLAPALANTYNSGGHAL